MVDEGLIDREEAILRIDPRQLDQLLHPMFDPAPSRRAATGLNASPGAACGVVVLRCRHCRAARQGGRERDPGPLGDGSPRHPRADRRPQGILTAFGGITSHAAVVARGMGKPCVAGVDDFAIDLERQDRQLGGHDVARRRRDHDRRHRRLVMLGAVALVPPRINADFQTLLTWADRFRRLGVHANADTPADALKARELGAEGSASAAPSTCSWPRTGCRSCAR